jgi:hypothetical protein
MSDLTPSLKCFLRSRGHFALLAPVLALVLAGCAAEIPSHLTRLWPVGDSGEPFLGLSTAEGVIVLSTAHYEVGDLFNIQFPVGNSGVVDLGKIDHLNDDLAVIRPLTSRLLRGRLGSTPPKADETIYLARRDEEDQPYMEPVVRWRKGVYGDYITVSGVDDPAAFARDYAGTGLYVNRKGRWKIVGMLAGITANLPGEDADDAGVGYIGLLELVRVLPDQIDYFQRDIKPQRPDFEYGVPLQPSDILIFEAETSDQQNDPDGP